MLLSSFYNIEKRLTSGFFSEQRAEMNLIKPLFENNIIKNSKEKLLFSKYPIVTLAEKGDVLCEIMSLMWPEGIIKNQYELLRNFEEFLTAIGKRDHFFHQFLVYLLGVNLIELILNKIKSTTKPEDIFGFKNKKDIYLTWLMASCFHDFGYPYQEASAISKKLSELYSGMDMDNLAEQFTTLRSTLNNKHDYNLVFVKISEEQNAEMQILLIHHFLLELIEEYLDIDTDTALKIQNDFIIGADHGYVSSILLCKSVINSHLYTTTLILAHNAPNLLYRTCERAMEF